MNLLESRSVFKQRTAGLVLGSLALSASLFTLGSSTTAGAQSSGKSIPAAVALLKSWKPVLRTSR